MEKNVKLVYDMQFGSTGKGLLIGKLCEEAPPGSVCLSTMAPNAGHTYVAEDGTKFIHSSLPLGAVFPNIRMIGIGPGSTVDMEKLSKELQFCEDNNIHGCKDQMILVHEHAGVKTPAMTSNDAQHLRIGSTMKGAGSAQIAKINRDKTKPCTAKTLWNLPEKIGRFTIRIATHSEWLNILNSERDIIVEGSQGYSLGLTSGMWPYTTYRECTPTQILTDCALPCKLSEVELYGVMRTYPIRVANRKDPKTGVIIGYSGPGYPDQCEVTWESLDLEPELTTVTKLQRRIFTFSMQQFRECIMHTRPDVVFLNFMNYLAPEEQEVMKKAIEAELAGEVKLWLGHGAKSSDIEEI